MDSAHARERFREIAVGPDDAIDLAEAALWIAAEEYPALDVPDYLARLDQLGEQARGALANASNATDAVTALNRFLYDRSGFAGNRDNYYDPRNSYLNEVIDRRRGIPITLAIVYLEVARRARLAVEGVGFPGHFLVKCTDGGDAGEVLIDPFAGEIISHDECAARYQALVDQPLPFDPSLLDATASKQILARVLGNLKQIHLVRNDFTRALACSERILLLLPDTQFPQELRDRGLLYARLECFAAALADLRRFLELAPHDASSDLIRRNLDDLARRVPQMH